jgi:hypothetical protein
LSGINGMMVDSITRSDFLVACDGLYSSFGKDRRLRAMSFNVFMAVLTLCAWEYSRTWKL